MDSQIPLWSTRKAPPVECGEAFQPYLTPYLVPGDQIRNAVIVLPGEMFTVLIFS